MRIALVAPRYPPDVGGVETHVERLATGLAARDIDVTVFVQSDVAGAETRDGVSIRRFRTLIKSPDFAFAPTLWRALRHEAHAFELIHAHSYHALPALGAALAGGPPLVVTPHFHGRGHSRVRDALHVVYRPLGRHLFHSAAVVICVSDPEAELVRRFVPHISDRLTVIPNGVDLEAIQRATPFSTETRVLLSVGRLQAYKRVDRSLEALSKLPPEWTLTVIGSGPQMDALLAQTRSLRLESRVQLLGQVGRADLHRWYRSAAAYVTLSTAEAFGMTTLEAAVAGAAVIASDIPAHRYAQTMAGSVDRFRLVDPAATASEIATTVLAAAEAPRSEGCTAPGWDIVVERTLQVYARAIGQRL